MPQDRHLHVERHGLHRAGAVPRIGNSATAGLELPDTHALHMLKAVLVDMRMPLFRFLSGLVFVEVRRRLTNAA